MKFSPLQILLAIDAIVLFVLGLLLMLAPRQVESAFHFRDLPEGVSYIIGLWGCVLVTVAMGYAVAALDPIRHVVWVQVAIARPSPAMTRSASHSGDWQTIRQASSSVSKPFRRS